MNLPWTRASLLLLGSCVAGVLAASSAQAGDYVTGTLASRCTDFGEDFIDMGNGICARVGSQTRVQLGTHSASADAWTSGGTSDAALRSTDSILPGASVEHLRVRSGLEASPFQ